MLMGAEKVVYGVIHLNGGSTKGIGWDSLGLWIAIDTLSRSLYFYLFISIQLHNITLCFPSIHH